jgi:hypothetical protein
MGGGENQIVLSIGDHPRQIFLACVHPDIDQGRKKPLEGAAHQEALVSSMGQGMPGTGINRKDAKAPTMASFDIGYRGFRRGK